ncbi:MAG TPA: YbhB/YbcL family Raf kinase inhibitor-like protein [Candidatus Sulfotelmatobacter sp.]|nr:YbhB/YbcL family Raf kinase inhibitor-like protein [Candidatus Sulfotelmatobacter sp.]
MVLFGRAIRRWRAGAEFRVAEDPRFSEVARTIALRSDAFADGGPMPRSHASPHLAWSGAPPETQTLALVVEDVDVPFPRPFVHAVAYDIEPSTCELASGALESTRTTMGFNGVQRRAYIWPSPIPGHGAHRYVFTLLAVDFVPRFDQPPTRGRLLDAIAGHVVALGELTGTDER